MEGGYQGWPRAGNVRPAGRLLVLDGGGRIFGYGRMAYRGGDGHVGPHTAKHYRLFAEVVGAEPADVRRGGKKRRIEWTAELPFVVRAIVLVRDGLLVAGGARQGPGTLWVAARHDGSKKFDCALPASPVLDGMAVTDGGVFVSTTEGSVVCVRALER